MLTGTASALSVDQPQAQSIEAETTRWEAAGDLDWDQPYQDFLPAIMASGNDFEYYRTMQRFCALLKDGHANVYVPEGLLEQYVGRAPGSAVLFPG